MRNIELLNLDVSTSAVPTVPPGLVARLEHNLGQDDLRPRVAILTLGCKVNYSETEALAENFQQAGYALVDPEGTDTPDVFIVNTCTVTHVAGRKSRQMLRRAKRANPQALVVATGCHVYTSREEVEAISEVDLVVGKAEEERMVELVSARLQYELPYRPEPSPLLFAGGFDRPALENGLEFKGVATHYRTRAMVKIQDGCNAGCAFCIVPSARGGPRSIGIAEVVEGVRRKVAAGYQEVVLTGVHLGKYRAPALTGQADERPVRLRALLEAVLSEVAVPRLRITSLEPQDYDPTLLQLWQQDRRLARHFHLALQAGCDATLARMRRGYNTEKYARIVEQIRHELPDASITTDIIVGFPGETEAEFTATLEFAERMNFSKIHVFPFSPREGTLAATMPDQIADGPKKERGERLRLLSDELSRRWRSCFINQIRPVLWESQEVQSSKFKVQSFEEVSSSRFQVQSSEEVSSSRFQVQSLNQERELGTRNQKPETKNLELETWNLKLPLWGGLTDNYLRVYAVAEGNLRNQITPVRLVELAGQGDAEGMRGEIVAARED